MNDDQSADHSARFDPNDLSNGQVVGIAVGAAVALGTLVMAFGPNEPEKPSHGGGRRAVVRGARSAARDLAEPESLVVVKNGKLTGRSSRRLEREVATLQQEIDRLGKIAERQARKDRAQVPVESVLLPETEMESTKMTDDMTVAVLKNGKLTRRSRKELRKQVNDIQKDIDRLNKAVRKEAYRQEHPAPTVDDLRETAVNIGHDASKRLAVAGAATSAAMAPLVERARHLEIPDGVQQAIGTAQKSARQFAESTQKGARQFADTTREQTSDLTGRVRGDLLPHLAQQAGKVQERVRDEFMPQVTERLQHLRDEVGPQLADTATKVGAQATALAATGVTLGRDKTKELAKTDLAADFSRLAKQQTDRGRKEAAKRLSALAAQIDPPKQKSSLNGLWIFAVLGAIGGALYYFVYLNEERRKKVVETTQSLVEQGREIIRDFQGYDEEF